jgi:hypothetical protein
MARLKGGREVGDGDGHNETKVHQTSMHQSLSMPARAKEGK